MLVITNRITNRINDNAPRQLPPAHHFRNDGAIVAKIYYKNLTIDKIHQIIFVAIYSLFPYVFVGWCIFNILIPDKHLPKNES